MLIDLLAVIALFLLAVATAFALATLLGSAAVRRVLPAAARAKHAPDLAVPPENGVTIPARPGAAIVKAMPVMMITCALLYVPIKIELSGADCVFVFGAHSALVSLLLLTHGVPIVIATISLVGVPTGIKVLRHGYFPPLDSAQIATTVATKGALSRVRGWVLVAFPVFAFYLVFFGHQVLTEILDGRSPAQIVRLLDDDCEAT